MSHKSQMAEITIEVTEEEYQADLTRGLAEDEILQPGRHTFRRGGFLARHSAKAEQGATLDKVYVSLDLDQDVFEFVRNRLPDQMALLTKIKSVSC